MLNSIRSNNDFTLVTRKQVDNTARKPIIAALYRTPKRRGFDYSVEVTRSVQASNGQMVDVESLSVSVASLDSLIAELQAARALLYSDMEENGS